MAEDDDLEKEADKILEEQSFQEEAADLEKDRALDLELAKFAANAFDRASTSLITVAVFHTANRHSVWRLEIADDVERRDRRVHHWLLGLAIALHLMGRGALTKGFK